MDDETTWIGGVRGLGRAGSGSELAIALIYDADADRIVGSKVVPGLADVEFGALFEAACRAPEHGAPRVPHTLVVDDEALARAVEALGSGVVVEVDEASEIDDLVEEFLGSLRGSSKPRAPATSFLGKPWSAAPRQGKRLEPLGARLLAAGPWKRIDEATPIRVSAPRLGLAEGVVGVFGALGQSPGFSIYRSARELRAFMRAAERGPDGDRPPPPLEAPLVTLTMTPRKRGPPETMALHVTQTWTSVEADRNELALAIAVAEALLRLGRAERVTHEGVTLSLEGGSVAPLRGPGPSQAGDGPPARLPDRNDPCWCGSGKKYKKCHLDVDAEQVRETRGDAGPSAGRSRWGPVLDRMYPRVLAWCRRKVPGFDDHLGAIARASTVELAQSHAIFVLPVAAGRPLGGESFRAEAGSSLAPEERQWLDANLDAAWTSYWQVEDVTPGRSITLRDIFSEEVRTVIEASASRMAAPGDLLCARVVTVSGQGGESYLDIAHSRVLGATDGLALREALAVELGLTKRKAVPVARLREPRVASALLARWVEAIRDQDRAPSGMKLANTDGEPFVLIEERFALRAPRAEVERALATMEHLERSELDGAEWILSRPGNAKSPAFATTTLARVTLEDGALVASTNSRERAARIRASLRACLGDALGPGVSDERDAESLMEEARERAEEPRPRVVPSLEEQAAMRAFKESHYTIWADTPLPALGDKTPRQAVKTVGGRKEVEAMLAELEGREHREPPGARFDVDSLRRALGLPTRAGA